MPLLQAMHKREKPAFERPLHISSGDVVAVRVCQPRKRSLQLDFDAAVTAEEAAALANQASNSHSLSHSCEHSEMAAITLTAKMEEPKHCVQSAKYDQSRSNAT